MLWLIRVALLLPAAAIVAAALPRLYSGAALETAFPATAYIGENVPLPQNSYKGVARILAHAPSSDGETQILRAEAAAYAGQPPATITPLLDVALSRAPASPRGWILLAALQTDSNPKTAAAALSLAIALAPREYYLVARQACAGAALWPYLAKDTRAKLVGDARILATMPEFRGELRILLGGRGGPQLVTRALAGNPEQLRQLNRSLAHEDLKL